MTNIRMITVGYPDAIPTLVTAQEHEIILRIRFCWNIDSNKCDGFGSFTEIRRLPSCFQSNCIEYSSQEIVWCS